MIKVGGLADVVGALPKALVALSHDVRIILPNYGAIDHRRFPVTTEHATWPVSWQGRDHRVRLLEGRLPDSSVKVYYLDCPEIFQPGVHGLSGVYANSNDPALQKQEIERFVFFSLSCVRALAHLDWQPDILHCHDWHTALVPIINRLSGPRPSTPTMLTIHNLQNQGRWSAAEVFNWLGWSGHESLSLARRDTGGDLNFLQQGIIDATVVNTVSPTYAQEILSAEYGEGLATDLSAKGVVGILNGIDTDIFNPATDKAIPIQYDQSSWPAAKKENKRRLRTKLGLAATKAPLFVSVGRFTPQKGFDLIRQVAPSLVANGGQLALLGNGLPDIEGALSGLANQQCSAVSVTLGFDAALAQQLYAAADFFLMPSRFEPCGLGQMIAMRYGAVPIVRDTGGLHDTVVDVVADPAQGTGFVFGPFKAPALHRTINAALQLYQQPVIVQVVERAMAQDFSWTSSARRYHQLYAQITKIT